MMTLVLEFEVHLSSRACVTYVLSPALSRFYLSECGIAQNSVNTRVPHSPIPYHMESGIIALYNVNTVLGIIDLNYYEVTTVYINRLLSSQGRAVYKPIAFSYRVHYITERYGQI